MSSNDDGNSVETPCVTKRPVGGSFKRDSAWDHSLRVENKPRNLICKCCSMEIAGGAYRFKHHLACTHKDVEPCMHVPDELKEKFGDILLQKRKVGQSSVEEDGDEESDSVTPKKHKGSLTSF